ncbi:MAG: TraR/DksA C4-type zinc finger protein [Acidobacteria bacterium]|nr:TraR/DksA C4-type zinc finger protein [Acidobacteriota bacterium]
MVLRRKESLKQRLQTQKEELLKAIQTNESTMAFFETSRHAEFSEEAQEEAAEIALKTLVEQQRKQFADIERALLKLDNDTYGICEKCGRSIPRARLRVLPEARFCLQCEEASETGV